MTKEPKPQPKRKNPKPDDPEQSKRFIEAARQTEVDETGEAFRQVFEKIVPPKNPPKRQSKDFRDEFRMGAI
jgi:hypothetical protein